MPSPQPAVEFELRDLAATESLARALALRARRSDVIALHGALGLGKTTFARAFIRGRAGGEAVREVPSPTFTLVQTYDLPGCPVWHFDLYRLTDPEETWELGIEEAFAEAISLIEWPERLGRHLPDRRLDVEFLAGASPDGRRVRLSGGGEWPRRLAGLNAHA